MTVMAVNTKYRLNVLGGARLLRYRNEQETQVLGERWLEKGTATKHMVIARTEAVGWAVLWRRESNILASPESPRMSDSSPDKGGGIGWSILAEQRGVEEHPFRDLLAVWL